MNQIISKELAVQDKNTRARELVAQRVKNNLAALLKRTDISGEFAHYGSFCNGFSTGDSDLDLTLLTDRSEDTDTVAALRKIATLAQSDSFNFVHVTRIFQANVPILKLSDAASGIEIDISVNNRLGVRNSKLLETYCKLDPRISHLGRLVKTWAKRYELVGTIDGYLNSYAYTLLVIYFLQAGCVPPLAPSLQEMAPESEYTKHLVKDARGATWSTNFEADLRRLTFVTQNGEQQLEMLLLHFFNFYVNVFDWTKDSVCIRVGQWGIHKANVVACPKDLEQWCIEDPFDLKHNLAHNCTQGAKRRILAEMQAAMQLLKHNAEYQIATVLNPLPIPGRENAYFLLLRAVEDIDPKLLLEHFEEDDLQNIFYPQFPRDAKPKYRNIYLEFRTSAARRKARAKTETFIREHRLRLHDSNVNAWQDALISQQHTVHSMADYIRHQAQDSTRARRLNPAALPFFPQTEAATHGVTPSTAAETRHTPSAGDVGYDPANADDQFKPFVAETRYSTWKASSMLEDEDGVHHQSPVKMKLSTAMSSSKHSDAHPAVSSRASVGTNMYNSELYRGAVLQKTASFLLQLEMAEQHTKALNQELERFQDLVGAIGNSWTLVNEDALPMLSLFKSFLLSSNPTLQALGVTQTRRLLQQVPTATPQVIAANMVPDLLTLVSNRRHPPDLLHDAAWALAIVCWRSECAKTTDALVHAGAIEIFVDVMNKPYDVAHEDAVRACGVIAETSASQRDACLRHGVASLVLRYARLKASRNVKQAAVFTMSRLCGGSPTAESDLIMPCLRFLVELARHEDDGVMRDARDALCNTLALMMMPESRSKMEVVLENGFIAPLAELMRDDKDVGAQKNACAALCYAIANGSDKQVQAIVMKYKVIQPLCDLLDAKDWEVVCTTLEIIGNILKVGSRMHDEERDHYANLVRDSGGVEKIKTLKDSDNSQVCTKALCVLTFFFSTHASTHDTVDATGPQAAHACPANGAPGPTRRDGRSGTATITTVSHCSGSASSETGIKETHAGSGRSNATARDEDRPLSRGAQEQGNARAPLSGASTSSARKTVASVPIGSAETTLQETEETTACFDAHHTTRAERPMDSKDDTPMTTSDVAATLHVVDTAHHAPAGLPVGKKPAPQESSTACTSDLVTGKKGAAIDGESQLSSISATRVPDSSEDDSGHLTFFNESHESSLETKPRDSAASVQTSMLTNHCSEQCKPCAFFCHKSDGCRRGDACKFCHVCGPEKLKEKRKRKKKLKRLRIGMRARTERINDSIDMVVEPQEGNVAIMLGVGGQIDRDSRYICPSADAT